MKKLLILGAGGNIAGHVIDLIAKKTDIDTTLFLRHPRRLSSKDVSKCKVVSGDVLNMAQLKAAVTGQDIVYANLAGDLETMAKNIIKVMQDTDVKRLIFISSVGIYDTPLKPVLTPYRKAADLIEASALDYTILRPTSFSDENEVDFELTRKGEPERGAVISQKSLATFITQVIASPDKHVRENLGINKPLKSPR
jgi:uncharacterized protein YbjT (DUF2867 family)